MSGSWPDVQIDHANGDRSDNRWANLRLATQRQNNANSRVRRNSKTGLRGVHLHETGLYRAYISKPGKSITHLGYFKTPEEAYAAYCQAAHETYGEFARSAPSKPDGWASYDIAIAAKREQLVRSGRERPVSEAEARWAEEGERPTRELETWKRRLA